MVDFLKRCWVGIKRHWQLAALITGTVVGYVLFRRREISFVDDYRQIQEAHRAELLKIEEARQEERKQHEENENRLKNTLDAVQKQYDEQKKQLNQKKKAEVEQIVKDYSNKPEELAKQLSAVTGFTIILSK